MDGYITLLWPGLSQTIHLAYAKEILAKLQTMTSEEHRSTFHLPTPMSGMVRVTLSKTRYHVYLSTGGLDHVLIREQEIDIDSLKSWLERDIAREEANCEPPF